MQYYLIRSLIKQLYFYLPDLQHPIYSDVHAIYCDMHPIYCDVHPIYCDVHPIYCDMHPIYSDGLLKSWGKFAAMAWKLPAHLVRS